MNPRAIDLILLGVLGLLAIGTVLQLLFARRKDQTLRAEIAATLADVRELRGDVEAKFGSLIKSMVPASSVTRSIDHRLESVRESLEERLRAMQDESLAQIDQAGKSTLAVANGQRQDNADALEKVKESLVATLDKYTQYLNKMVSQSLAENAASQRSQIATIVEHLTQLIEATDQKLDAYRRESDARMQRIQAEVAVVGKFSSATRAFGSALAHEFDHVDEAHFPAR